MCGVVLTFSLLFSTFLCPPVASPTHGGHPVDDARGLSHLTQLGAVRLVRTQNCNNSPSFLVTPSSISTTLLISSPHLFVCQDFQPYFLAGQSAAPPPPPPPPSDELLDPPPKPPFADEEEEEEMLLRETCLMSMANKRVVATEVGPAARGL